MPHILKIDWYKSVNVLIAPMTKKSWHFASSRIYFDSVSHIFVAFQEVHFRYGFGANVQFVRFLLNPYTKGWYWRYKKELQILWIILLLFNTFKVHEDDIVQTTNLLLTSKILSYFCVVMLNSHCYCVNNSVLFGYSGAENALFT